MLGETREAIKAFCVELGLVVYEWNDLHEKLAQPFALICGETGGKPLPNGMRFGATRGSAKSSGAPLPKRRLTDGKSRHGRPTISSGCLIVPTNSLATAITPSTRHAHSTFGETAHPR